MTNAEHLKKLAALAKRWGGQLLQVSQGEYDRMKNDPDFSEAPFTESDLGINHSKKIIAYVDPETPWYQVVHEMAHVFACEAEPHESEEFAFFGWEVALAKKFKGLAEWLDGNKDYGVNPYLDFGMMEADAKDALIKERLACSQQLGLVKRGQPVAIR